MTTAKRTSWFLVCGAALLALLAGAAAAAGSAPAVRHPTAAAPDAAGDWLHFGYDGSFTADNPFESRLSVTNVAGLQRIWGIGCDDGWFSVISRSPAIHDGVLYSAGAGRNLIAQNARSGAFLWDFGAGNAGWAPQPVVSEDGIVFYLEGLSGIYDLYAVDGSSGSQLWVSPIGFDIGFNESIVVTVDEANGLVYVPQVPFMGDGHLYALDMASGAISWYMGPPVDNVSFLGDYVLLHDGHVYAHGDISVPPYGDLQDFLLDIDPLSQTVVMTYTRPQPEDYYDIQHYILCNDHLIADFDYQYNPVKQLVGYDLLTPTISWQKPFSATTGAFACDAARNIVYVPTNPYLYALDAGSGEELWRYMGYGPIYNPSIANGVIYFLSDTNMWAIDQETHQQLLHWPLGYTAEESTRVAIAGGMVYFSGNGGTCDLSALGLLDQRVFLPLLVRGQ